MKPLPSFIPNRIGGRDCASTAGREFQKLNPATGASLARVALSDGSDAQIAVAEALGTFSEWSEWPAVKRGAVLFDVAEKLRERRKIIAETVALETGKPMRLALAEADGAVALARFMAGEGQRLYGRTTTSEIAGKMVLSVRRPVGVAALIVPANTPVPNLTWKIFPALVAGNTAVLKASEDAPATAWLLASIAEEAGLPPGVLNVIQGLGPEAGEPLVRHPGVALVSFTGSTAVGRRIAVACAERVVRVSLELGGKNPFLVCADADLETAVHWALLSAFSNSGQRCAAASRFLVHDAVYDKFRDLFCARAAKLKVGAHDEADMGPLMRESQLERCLGAVHRSREEGGRVLTGGERLKGQLAGGFFIAPTLVENVSPCARISREELFGPVACLYRVADDEEALRIANDSPYGLTAAVHSRSVDRSLWFSERLQAGTVAVNAGTHGSEPHLPFGGVKLSGNGTREPGTEALDFYTNLKTVTITVEPRRIAA